MSSYVILVKYAHDGAHLDSCLDVSYVTDRGNAMDWLAAEKVAVRLGQPADPTLDRINTSIRGVSLRARVDGGVDGPFLIHVPEPLTREEIEMLLQDKDTLTIIRNGRLA